MPVDAGRKPQARQGAAEQTGKPSLAEEAYRRLEEMIVTLELRPGSVLSETELSRRIRIGRTPMREALQRLQAQRLVTTLPRRGVEISEINIVDYLALLDTRRVLDRLVATKAARRALPDQREALEKVAAGMVAAASRGDMTEYMRLDTAFDRLLEEASRSAYALRASVPLHAHCRRFWYLYRHNGDLTRAAELHAAMMRAVARGSEPEAGEAADALVDYLEEFARTALDLA
ncbi:MAG TPA: GntR family transcriptional regulator [Bacteroidota bacterium]|nr:GntR family transcriptional regulator [Bacteroidota bacterium]